MIPEDGEGGAWRSSYEIYGVWVGYDENSQLLNRSVKPLAMMAGSRLRMLYPVDSDRKDGKTVYTAGEEMTMYRALRIEEIPLPAGTYYLEYEMKDIFMRSARFERIEIRWDGENISFPEGFAWEGTSPVTWWR